MLLNVELIIIVVLASIAAGAIIYLIRKQRDISLIVKVQENTINELTEKYRQTVSEYSNKAEFFTNVVHELKTPISIILGALQLSEHKTSSAEHQKNPGESKIIRQNCYRMLRLINNLLESSKLDSGWVRLNAENINIAGLTEEITRSVFPFAAQKGLRLLFDTEADDIRTAVDIDKMERILLNLLSNAVKFTPFGGSVMVSVKSSGGTVSISVRDSGPGIPENKQVQIFERFRQTGDRPSAETQGSGLGLSIAKAFVELMNGNIKLKSELGKGSEFTIELPIRAVPYEKCNPGSAANQDKRIFDNSKIELSDIYESTSNTREF